MVTLDSSQPASSRHVANTVVATTPTVISLGNAWARKASISTLGITLLVHLHLSSIHYLFCVCAVVD